MNPGWPLYRGGIVGKWSPQSHDYDHRFGVALGDELFNRRAIMTTMPEAPPTYSSHTRALNLGGGVMSFRPCISVRDQTWRGGHTDGRHSARTTRRRHETRSHRWRHTTQPSPIVPPNVTNAPLVPNVPVRVAWGAPYTNYISITICLCTLLAAITIMNRMD